ncbi:hypothetical protein LZ30DRAFT_729337 [Colletotrichum cereale]|nr:hypothetical protein LZ30DRAFT_729337 [Colletotrichum cereale]
MRNRIILATLAPNLGFILAGNQCATWNMPETARWRRLITHSASPSLSKATTLPSMNRSRRETHGIGSASRFICTSPGTKYRGSRSSSHAARQQAACFLNMMDERPSPFLSLSPSLQAGNHPAMMNTLVGYTPGARRAASLLCRTPPHSRIKNPQQPCPGPRPAPLTPRIRYRTVSQLPVILAGRI